MKYPDNMDAECIPICDALNALPGIKTHESCCGHGAREFVVFFEAANIADLIPILEVADSSGWKIEVSLATRIHFRPGNYTEATGCEDIASFALCGPVGPVSMPGGANDFAAWLSQSSVDEKMEI